MNTKSIYESPKRLDGMTARDTVAMYASERHTAEQLVVMGYKFCGRQNIQQRIKFLDEEIQRQEKLAKLEQSRRGR